jgi:hypothetical protein
MLGTLIEAALRSLVLASITWACLRIFRIRNVFSQHGAWTAVLIGSLLMPFVLPFAARWHLPQIATIPAPSSIDRLQSVLAPEIVSMPASTMNTAMVHAKRDQHDAPTIPAGTASRKLAYVPHYNRVASPAPYADSSPTTPKTSQFMLIRFAMVTYSLIAAALLIRLLFGLAVALRLWYSSHPFVAGNGAQIGTNLRVRFSRRISTPVTIGSGIVLPADYSRWSEEKLRIVLAHERSHVCLRDFYLQILASLYVSLTWFSPLGWWLKHKLSDLGEAISDRSGLNAASNRSAYAEVLLEFAAVPRPTLIGVAMARPTSVSRRIERLLNDSYLRHAFSGSARTRIAVLAASGVLFTAAALVRVQAVAQSGSFAPDRIGTTATLSTPRAASDVPSTSAPGMPAIPAAQSHPEPPEFALASPPSPPGAPAALENGTTRSEATFDRNLTFTGKLDLSVGTTSGNITFTRGPANQIHIHGIVKANRNGDPAQVQQIAANPPIEQEGNTIRIGAHGENLQNISISYEIEAPAGTTLNAATASGDIANTGVGDGARMTTASGNITATGLESGFIVQTGSGNITIEGTGQGDAKAQTGSGDIDLKGVNGALKAQTGSGTIRAAGKPSYPWKLQTGSGTIELAAGSAPMDLDASTGSGSIITPPSMSLQNSSGHHQLKTQLNGGGPEVRVETGSGDIRID